MPDNIEKIVDKIEQAVDKTKDQIQQQVEKKTGRIRKIINWYKQLPLAKKIIYGIIGGLILAIPFALTLVAIFVIDWGNGPKPIIPDVNNPPVVIKPNPAGTDIPNENLALSIDKKLAAIKKDLN